LHLFIGTAQENKCFLGAIDESGADKKMKKEQTGNAERYIREAKLNTFDLDKRRCWDLTIIGIPNGFRLHSQSLRELRWDICKNEKLVDYIREETCVAVNWSYVTTFEIFDGCPDNSWCQKEEK
jgi:hypothetical protein